MTIVLCDEEENNVDECYDCELKDFDNENFTCDNYTEVHIVLKIGLSVLSVYSMQLHLLCF